MSDKISEISGYRESKKMLKLPDGLDRVDAIALLIMDYIERVEQGEDPTLPEYTRLYPEFEDELKISITQYWLETRISLQEIKNQTATEEYQKQLAARLNDPKEKEQARQAVTNIMVGVESTLPAVEEKLESLYKRAREKKLSPPQLARKLSLPSDIMMALEQRLVNLTGIPRRIISTLSETLDVSHRQVIIYLSGGVQTSTMYLAEDKPTEANRQDFADYVRQSYQSNLINENDKESWLKAVETDSLSQEDLL